MRTYAIRFSQVETIRSIDRWDGVELRDEMKRRESWDLHRLRVTCVWLLLVWLFYSPLAMLLLLLWCRYSGTCNLKSSTHESGTAHTHEPHESQAEEGCSRYWISAILSWIQTQCYLSTKFSHRVGKKLSETCDSKLMAEDAKKFEVTACRTGWWWATFCISLFFSSLAGKDTLYAHPH